MRISSFNANGLRSALSKGFFDWFSTQDIDVLCVQETKAQRQQLVGPGFFPAGYHVYFRDATTKKGYSGVAIYSRCEPDELRTTLGWAEFDEEGRYVEARFGNLSVVSFYIPSGSSGEQRQHYKFEVMRWLRPILCEWLLSGRDYVLCGDWNIVRSALDIRNWKSNQKNSGCLPLERDWLNGLCADSLHDVNAAQGRGWIDTYRVLYPQGEDYTWWSNRGAARVNNVGWRIDYQFVSPGLRERVSRCAIYREQRFSDHAPYTVEYVL
ncbi:exodeoxyribonuclease III [Xylella fastidiosa subsp. pauca]|uniref:exodeoxyribonuclease III n=1 Tax=Xylella fastidiosa TaxID=2371 RepID=UPI000583DC3E|nr:exodeoxyribonuclease III [Xylella fastidiosa]ARO67793.1 exodeoxyribonuclease III [Xylella fastidiosa subsp. pauca]AVI19986.1 exodeoxyribonuclease III [Xylella fastidiosa]AVI21980.1 exodeoxyribonuclease III [Xylella fastidiosa]KIA58976.1 DNA-(apurinic or apyrimidinic site) lyase [Xylella fastidiosa]KXB12283.1 DNA-(apurinic or apyrimidinic site) lyase [Xylella fastidiosa]